MSSHAIDNESYSIFVSEVQELLQCITTCVKQPREHIDLQELFRFAHTLKGVLAVYSLDAAVSATHAMEDGLHKLQLRATAITKIDRLRLQKATHKMGKEIVAGLKKLSANMNKKKGKTSKSLAKSTTDQPLLLTVPASNDEIGSLEIPTLYDRVEIKPLSTMAPILKKYLDTADVLARKLGKKIDIHFSGAEVPVPQTGMTMLFASVLHLIRNAVDHGIEPSAKRLAGGKPERGQLKLMARRYRGMFVLCIADDGAGINTRQIRNMAVRRGLLSKSAAAQSSQADLINLIFVPGFSLKQRVSQVSGRGVGMDAVKYAVEKHGGRMEIKTEVDKGTVMKILIPYAEAC